MNLIKVAQKGEDTKFIQSFEVYNQLMKVYLNSFLLTNFLFHRENIILDIR